jgi:hypothetical protein
MVKEHLANEFITGTFSCFFPAQELLATALWNACCLDLRLKVKFVIESTMAERLPANGRSPYTSSSGQYSFKDCQSEAELRETQI